MSGRSSERYVRAPGSSRNVVSATSTSAARCRRALHKHTTHRTESAQRGHAQQGQAQQVHATRAWEAQARIPQAYTASACTAGTRNASMGDTSTTTQACTAPAQSTGRCTPAMSTTLTSGCRTIWANAAQVHHTPSTRVHSSSTHRMGTRSRHGLEHAHVDDTPSVRTNLAMPAQTRRAAPRGHARAPRTISAGRQNRQQPPRGGPRALTGARRPPPSTRARAWSHRPGPDRRPCSSAP